MKRIRDLLGHAFGLANIYRYTRLHTIKKQTVAEHSFNVALILLTMIAEAPQFSPEEKFNILACGLLHDMEESLMGDIVGPIKERLSGVEEVELDSAKKILNGKLLELWKMSRDDYHHIVKLADIVDRYFYSLSEVELGNKEPYVQVIVKKSREAIQKLGGGLLDG